MFDSHCHLDAREFKKDFIEVIERAKAAGVKGVVNPISDFASNARVLELAKHFPDFVFPALGLDPVWSLREKDKLQAVMDLIEEKHREIVAVGEVGLDYFHIGNPALRVEQRKNFTVFIDKAAELGLPVIVHSRLAMQDTLETLKQAKADQVVMHYFSGTETEMRECVSRGYWVSFATNHCYGGEVSKRLISKTPLENMLCETDGPYSHPDKKGRNEPALVKRVVELVAQCHEIAFDQADLLLTQNAKKAFSIK